MGKKTWSEKQFVEAVRSSITIADVLRKLGLTLRPGNYRTVHKYVKEFGLDISHWDSAKAQAEANKRVGKLRQIPLSDVLTKDSGYNRGTLKKRLIKDGYLEYKCNICGISEWRDRSLTLQLDHINGVHDDNRIENLRLLCPNCHSQTNTYNGKALKKTHICNECGNRKETKKSVLCRSCESKKRVKINWPPVTEILDLLKHSPYTKVAEQIGVTDNGIRKYLLREIGYYPKRKGAVA